MREIRNFLCPKLLRSSIPSLTVIFHLFGTNLTTDPIQILSHWLKMGFWGEGKIYFEFFPLSEQYILEPPQTPHHLAQTLHQYQRKIPLPRMGEGK